MFVENQPFTPNDRACNPGATIVFIKVCPVLKSFPAIGTFSSNASCSNAGISIVRLGAPFANGTPDFIAAYA